ncbi:MAG: class I SAM-dependent methyltransferase [Opitutaceae bacterium]|nr:class I SAM-dependent methyltransferase [Opitutaceae bacterium]
MPNCRFCQHLLKTIFANLNMAPIVNNYIKPEHRFQAETFYPLVVYACDRCHLVQTMDFNPPEQIFTDEYAYFSSYSSLWLKHAEDYVGEIIKKLGLNSGSRVMEIASNDGYLLQYFKRENIPCLGIEPCKSVADTARQKGIDTIVEFFSTRLARELPKADLICMANVLAHVPDINDFVQGIKIALAGQGTVTIEFPHLLNLIKFNQFDTIYLEHYSYLSLLFVEKLFDKHGLRLYNVEEVPTHGGSLRVYGCHAGDKERTEMENVRRVLEMERDFGLDNMETYRGFGNKVRQIKRNLLSLLNDLKNQGKNIAAYSASAKGNTLFNYCGISTDYIDYTVDLNPHKQNTLLPGSRIPVRHPDTLAETRPDYILITAWNIKDEIIKQLEYTKAWNCRFITAIPQVEVIRDGGSTP